MPELRLTKKAIEHLALSAHWPSVLPGLYASGLWAAGGRPIQGLLCGGQGGPPEYKGHPWPGRPHGARTGLSMKSRRKVLRTIF